MPATNIPPIHPTLSNTPQTNMSAVPFRMPRRATDKAPKFDGKDKSLLIFIDDYEDLVDQAQLQNADRIKGLIKYVPTKDRSLWAGIPEANAGDYATFIMAVKDMYPGCESDKCYTVNDLQTVSRNRSCKPMTSVEAEGEYYREFTKVSIPLTAKDHVGKAELNRLYLEGFPSDVQQQICTRMMIKFPDHHPEDPYPIKDVRAAACFLLLGNSLVVPLPTSMQVQGPSPSPRNIALQAPIYQQPMGGAVVKQECHVSQSGTYSMQGCMFCGSKEHYLSCCRNKIVYIEASKCKVNKHTQKLVLPDGRWIPGKPQEGLLKERLDCYHTNQQANEALPSSSMTAGIFVCAEPEVGAIVEVDSSAFAHTIVDANSEVDEDELEVERAVQALTLATAKCDQKKAGSANSSKGCNMHFDGVDMSSGSRTRPGPALRQLADAEEIVSPAVQVMSGKGKAPEIAKAPSASTTSASKSKDTAKAPSVASTIESASSTATLSSSSSAQYRYSFALEDKDADKHVVQRLLECNINMPVRELFAVSPDVRKQFHDLTTTKHVTIGTVSVNKLSSQQTTEEFMCAFDQDWL